jgi:hypothetical protein
MQILTNEVNFGKVLLNSNPVNSLIIQNLGNTESGDYRALVTFTLLR